MKLSKFNVIREHNENIFIYNTFTGSILHLEKEYASEFKSIKETRVIKDNSSELVENLKLGKMLIEEDLDEINFLIAHNNISRFSNISQNYTIAPTMKCNFRCPYCYEKNIDYQTMSEEVITAVKKLLKEAKEISRNLSISWYGGEPLIAFNIIEKLSREAISLFGDNYCAGMVTNGYLLNKEISSKLEELKIINLQITIDGPPEIHNLRRRLPNGRDTFFVILENIKETLGINKSIQITIRVNADKLNINRVDEILAYLEDYGLKDKVGLYLAPVDNINDTCNPLECFDNHEFAIEQIKFIERNFEKGYNFAYLPQTNVYMCGAVAANSCVIDALGDLYKCWDDVGNKNQKVGSVFDNSSMENAKITKWLSYTLVDDKECLNCSFLPVCMGGCPNYRIKNSEKRCIPIKENADEMIRLLYKYHKNQKNEVK